MRNPYDVLGIQRSASQDDVKKAHRRLVKELHPDLNPGDRLIEQRFKEVSAAYELLGDPAKRARFDRGELDADGRERPDMFRRAYAGADARGRRRPAGSADFFEDFFGRGGIKTKGADVSYALAIGFREAASGARRRVILSDGRSIEVTIPPGTDDGQTLRLKGQGLQGMGGGTAGDALIDIRVEPDPHFTRQGLDIHLEVPVTLSEAVLGATIEVPTIDGKVKLAVPKGSNTGSQLRLKGKGIVDRANGRHGDQYVRLKIVLPDQPDADLTAFVGRWAPKGPYDPRRKAGF